MEGMTSQSFCIDGEDLMPAAIAILRKRHPGALPISTEWKTEGDKTALVIWWCPPSPPEKPRSCNRHDDCDKAEATWREWNPHKGGPPASFHCHDECCEECFGN
jgi:hypothetical protein